MVLTIVDDEIAPKIARDLLTRSKQEVSVPEVGSGIIEMIAIIMTYRFINLTRQEVEAMLGVTFQETRVYKDAKEEGRQEGWKEGRQEGRQEGQNQERLKVILLLLNQKFGTTSRLQMARVKKLLPGQMEKLIVAILSFETKNDLKSWLDKL